MQTSWIPFIPPSASTLSGKVDALYFYLSGVTVFFTLLISGVLIFFVIKYRRRTPFEIPRPIAGSHKLETLWSVIPFIIAMSMFAWGAQVYFQMYRPPKNALEIYVVGKQWMWKIQHSTGQREINELHVPAGRKIKLIMTSEDMIHDFFIPAFRIKADVLPGGIRRSGLKRPAGHLSPVLRRVLRHESLGNDWLDCGDAADRV